MILIVNQLADQCFHFSYLLSIACSRSIANLINSCSIILSGNLKKNPLIMCTVAIQCVINKATINRSKMFDLLYNVGANNIEKLLNFPSAHSRFRINKKKYNKWCKQPAKNDEHESIKSHKLVKYKKWLKLCFGVYRRPLSAFFLTFFNTNTSDDVDGLLIQITIAFF